jgi:acetyl-CoA carboxylase alpha subunit
MVHEAQAKAATAEEALRLCKEKLKKQELIDELAAEYRAKGISEDEIEEFIAREYHMYDDAKS